MSKAYSFDDKILHIESLQLKRTDEILNSREEAVEALLNYCGDDTMDGMPLLARYWADSGQTEIKHIRGYIHNIDGHMGISVDDIVDVDEIYDYIDSAMTSNSNSDDENYVIKKRFPIFFKPKYNYYYQGTGIQFQLPSLRPGMYAQVVFPEYLKPYAGDVVKALKSTKRAWVKSRGWINVTAWQMLTGEARGGTKGEYTGDGWLKVGFVECDGYNLLNIVYEKHSEEQGFLPSMTITMSRYDDGKHNMLVTNDVGSTIGIDSRKIAYTEEQFLDLDTVMDTEGRAYNMSYPEGTSITVVDYRDKFNIVGSSPTKKTTSPGFLIEKGIIKCYRESSFADALKKYAVFSPERRTGTGGYWGKIWSSPIYYEALLHGQIEHKLDEDLYFRHYIEELPKTKNGIVLYYNPRNAYCGGVSPDVVVAHNYLLNHICSDKAPRNLCEYSTRGFRMRKHEGRIEYKAPVKRGRVHFVGSDGTNSKYCLFYVQYEGIDNGTYAFNVKKNGEHTTEITIDRIYVNFVGEDGNWHVGYFNMNYNGDNVFKNDTDHEERIVHSRAFFVKDEVNNCFNLDNTLPSQFFGTSSFKVLRVVFDFEITKETSKIIFFNTYRHSSERKSYSKWKILNRVNYVKDGSKTHRLPSSFNKNKFNVCRYYKKFKGVLSEFPETFYTR